MALAHPTVQGVPAPLPDGCRGLFTMRAGGVSAGPWAGLNLALHVQDEPRRVLANRDLLSRHLGAALQFVRQVHGATVGTIAADRLGRLRLTPDAAAGADALVTDLPGVALVVLVADCAPILLADVAAGVVAAAHGGRRGLLAGVAQATVAAMAELGADPARIVASLGPAARACCYEVPAEMQAQVGAVMPAAVASARDGDGAGRAAVAGATGGEVVTRVGTPALDLPAAAAAALRQAGVATVHDTGICTIDDSRFYSHRRANPTGRFAGAVVRDAPRLRG